MIDFPEKYFEAEEREGFLISSMMKKAWAAQMEMLQYIRNICDRHNIKWFADYGTLLGAVRHKGFILWDDDIDISMTRENMDKFVEVCKTELTDEYRLICMENDTDYNSVMIRLMNASTISTDARRMEMFHGCPYCIGIDITPMDYVPIDDAERHEYVEMINSLYVLHNRVENGEFSEAEKEILIDQIESQTGGTILRDRELHCAIMYLIEQITHIYTKDDPCYLTGIWRITRQRDFIFPKEWFDDLIELPFENITVPVPREYDAVLKSKVGADYMTPIRYEAHDYPFYKAQEALLTEALGYKPL